MAACLFCGCFACTDIGTDIRNDALNLPGYSCLDYDASKATFFISCSFVWPSEDTCILLLKNEKFEGNNHIIDLNGFGNWTGLIQISAAFDDGPTSLDDAPEVRNVHTTGGQTSLSGGFILRPGQNHFIVHSCSSSGEIRGSNMYGEAGGGICGHACSGHIRITKCSSSGTIGEGGGGIAGREFGNQMDGKATITHCFSTGDIAGEDSGGICGSHAGTFSGYVSISHSYSRGEIKGQWSGGICGSSAGDNDGEVFITNSHSTGDITGSSTGGICGPSAGFLSGQTSITHAYSTGEITGHWAGGICGWGTGNEGGHVSITHSHSTGDIVGSGSGGICGRESGTFGGAITIAQCYSLGTIGGDGSGGITGGWTASVDGLVTITNCYSRGNITGSDHSGGICGLNTCGQGGTVNLKNVYASGAILHADAGGIIGHIQENAKDVSITMSVYNGEQGPMIGKTDKSTGLEKKKNSDSIDTIAGTVYCYTSNDGNVTECWDTQTIWEVIENDFPKLSVVLPTPNPTVSSSPTPSGTTSWTSTPSKTPSSSLTLTNTPTRSRTNTGTATASVTSTPTQTYTGSSTASSTYSRTATQTETSTTTPSSTASVTSSTSPSETATVTSTSTPTNTASFTSSETPSSSLTSTNTPTQSKTNTGTVTPSVTSSGTPGLTGSQTPTSAVTSTPSKTRTPTETLTAMQTNTGTPTQSNTPSITGTSSTSPTPTPSITGSLTPSVTSLETRTSTQTVTITPSNTETSTPSVTRSATSSCTGTPSTESTATATPTPSDLSPVNASRLISSACGVFEEFDCVSVEHEVLISIDDTTTRMSRNNLRTEISNASVITAQSVAGHAPRLSFLCGLDVDGVTVNPVPCFDHSIPFYVESEIVSTRSCVGRIKRDKCQSFVFVVNILHDTNVSDSQMRSLSDRTLDEEESSTIYAMKTTVSSNNEVLLHVRQIVAFKARSSNLGKPIEFSSHPSKFTKVVERDRNTLNHFNISVQLAGRSDLIVSWSIPPELSKFTKVPDSAPIASRISPSRLAVRNEIIQMQTHLLSHGVSVGRIRIMFSLSDELVATRFLEVNITVFEGDVRLRRSFVEIAQSSTEGSASRDIPLSNEGDKTVKWRSRKYLPANGGWEETAIIPWLHFPLGDSLSASSEIKVPIQVSPQFAPGVGVFQAWILIETDAWTGDSQNLDDEFDEVTVPLFAIDGVSFWIHVRLIVNFIFVCQQFAPVTPLMPHQSEIMPLRIVNTVSAPVTVRVANFSITLAENGTKSRLLDEALVADSTIKVETVTLNRVVSLTPWWTIAPSRLAIRTGTGGFRMKIAHTDRKLEPAKFMFTFMLEVFIGSDTDNPAGTIKTDFIVAFVPGVASPITSYLQENGTKAGIGDSLNFVIPFLDAFGHGPAKALFDSEDLVSQNRGRLPALTITIRPVGVSKEDVVTLHVFSRRGVIAEFWFALNLQGVGQVELDARLGNDSITGFPVSIKSILVQCRREFEEPDTTGTVCVCYAGHHRTESGQCSPCLPGTFMGSPSNDQRCSSCPKGTFSEQGQLSCDSCATNGVQCKDGVIVMEEGYWCELCQELLSPRDVILERIRNTKETLFHQCVPPGSCIVNSTSFSSRCASGYAPDGPVCDKCENGFVKVESGECMACDNDVQNLILSLVGFIVIVVTITVISVLSYRDVVSAITLPPAKQRRGSTTRVEPDRRLSLVEGSDITMRNPLHNPPKRKSSAKIQSRALTINLVSVRHVVLLLVDYFQIAFILHTMEISPFASNSEWVNAVSSLASLSPSQAGAFQCTVDSDPFQTSITTILSPLAVLVCALIIQTLVTLRQSRCRIRFPCGAWISSFARTAVVLMNLIHMSVTQATLEVFDIYPIKIDSKERSALDLEMETTSSRYKLLEGIAITSLIVFVIGYPAFTVAYYIKLYSKAHTPEALKTFSKVTGGFRVNGHGFLWETIVITRKLALLLVVAFVNGPIPQLILSSTTLILSVFLLAVLMPYKKALVNHLQYLMILTCLVSICIGFLMSLARDVTNEPEKVDALSNVVFALQLSLFLIAVITTLTMMPKAVEALKVILREKLPRCIGTCRKKERNSRSFSQGVVKRNKWSYTRSPLHDEKRGAMLPNVHVGWRKSSFSLQSSNVVLQSSRLLQIDTPSPSSGLAKVQRPRKRSKATLVGKPSVNSVK